MPTLHFGMSTAQMASGVRPGVVALERLKRSARSTAGPQGLGALSRQMGVTSSATFILRRHLFGLTAGLSGVVGIGNFIRVIGQLEKNMATVAGITKGTRAELEQLDIVIRTLALATEFSTSQISSAAVQIARSGKTAEEALKLLSISLDLATASGIDLTTVSDTLIKILNQFGAGVTEAARTADILVTASNSAVVTIQELMTALTFVGPLAAKAGLSLEETAASLQVLANAGVAGSRAGTTFRGILAALTGPTNQAVETLQDLGGVIADLNPEANSMLDIMTALKNINPGLGALSAVFRRRTAGGAAALIADTESLAKFVEKNKSAQGATKDLAELIRATLIPQLARLKSAFEEALITAGRAGATDRIMVFIENLRGAILIIAGASGRLENLTPGMLKFANALRAIGTGIVLWGAYRLALLAASVAMGIFNTVTTANPIGLVVVAIGAAIVAMQIWGDRIVEIEGKIFSLSALAMATMTEIASVIAFDVKQIIKLIVGAFNVIKDLFVFFVNDTLGISFKEIQEFWGRMWTKIVDIAKSAINIVINLFNGMSTAIVAIGGGLIDHVKGVANILSNLLDDPFNVDVWRQAVIDLTVTSVIGFKDMSKEVRKAFTDEWGKDWIPVMKNFALDSIAEMKKIYLEEFDIDLDAIIEKNNPTAILDRIFNRAEKLHRDQIARAAALRAEIAGAAIPQVDEGFIGPPAPRATVMTESARQLLKTFTELVTVQDDLLRMARLTAAEREAEKLSIQAALIAKKAEGAITTEMLQSFKEAIRIRQQTEAAFAIDETIRLLIQEQQQILLTAKAAESLRILTEVHEEALQAGGRLSVQQEILLEQEIARTQRLREVAQLSKSMGDSIASAFGDWVLGATSAKEALRQLAAELTKLILQQLALQPLADALSGIFSGVGASIFGRPAATGGNAPGPGSGLQAAKGVVFDAPGHVSRFARGGTVSGATFFGHAGGLGLMGEAGPEAILPLKRGPGGRLGVEASGAGGTIVVNMTINGVRDPDTFRRSAGQVASTLRRAINRR